MLTSLFLVAIISFFLIFFLKKKKPKKDGCDLYSIPDFKENFELLKRAERIKDLDCIDQAYCQVIVCAELLNYKNNNKFFYDVKSLRIQRSIFRSNNNMPLLPNYEEENNEVKELKRAKKSSAQYFRKYAAMDVKNDIETSILMLKESIKLSPEIKFDYYYKLAQCYWISSRKKEAFQVYNDLICVLDRKDFYNYHANVAEVTEKISIKRIAENELTEFIKSHFILIFSQVLSMACRGNTLELTDFFKYYPKIQYTGSTRFLRFVKNLNGQNERKICDTLDKYFETNRQRLFEMSKIAENVIHENKESLNTYKRAEVFNSIIRKNKTFMQYYNSFDGNDFITFFDRHIKSVYSYM